ncbi:MAG: calcium-binding protein [Actinomycetota bacterium]|nr:calcium-binding protein [Actinomycetota bacterium]
MRSRTTQKSCALAIAVFVSLHISPASALTNRIDERFSDYTAGKSFDDGQKFGHWRVVFDGVNSGHGVHLSKSGLLLAPQSAQTSDTTNSTLVVSRKKFTDAPLHLSATWTTQRTTRLGAANPWETGWLIWDYVDASHFTYLILKPNGWEVGRRDPGVPGGQRFIADAPSPVTTIGMKRSATVDRLNGQTTISVDGAPLTSFTLTADESRGSVGMYSEDAVVLWSRIVVATN